MTIELRHLRAVIAVADHGTVTAAAAALHVGQPALSRTLRRLETHLGVRLIDRSTHHLAPTPAGERFLVRARAAVGAVDALLDPAGLGSWPLRLGHAWSAAGDRTGVLLRRWTETHPDTPLELRQIDVRGAGLLDGRSDVALVRGELAVPGVRTRWLRDEPRVAVVAADSPLAGAGELRLADLARHRVAVNPLSGSTTTQLWPPGQRPDTLTVAGTEEWLVAIASGRAVGVSSAATELVHPFPGVAFRPLSDAPALPVLVAWIEPPVHPEVPALVELASAVVGAG